jgi:hypothetical protein
MDMRRYLPILLLAFAALFILPQLLKGTSSSKTLSAKARGSLTLDAIGRVDRAEQRVFAAGGKYTANLADLVATDKVLASELTVPLTVDLDITDNGKGYLARISSDVVSVARARTGTALVTQSCSLIKSRVGVKCPVGTTAPTTTTSTTTTPTKTETSTTGTITTITTK